MSENLYPQLPTAPPINQESFNIEMVMKTLRNLKRNILKNNGNIRMLTIDYYMHPQVQALLPCLVVLQLCQQL